MARKARALSELGIYHVLLRGVDSLFKEAGDYAEFASILKKYTDSGAVNIFAYTLLKNRIHLVIYSSDDIGIALKPICTSYARYFNRTHGGSGKLFYDRFKSEPINSEEELFGVVSFVNLISEKNGKDYPHCSLSAEGRKICNRDGRLPEDKFSDTEITAMYLDEYDSESPERINEYIFALCGVMPKNFKHISREEQEAALEKLTARRWLAKTKLYSILGISKVRENAEAPKKAEKAKKVEKTEEAQNAPRENNRELSVWLL